MKTWKQIEKEREHATTGHACTTKSESHQQTSIKRSISGIYIHMYIYLEDPKVRTCWDLRRRWLLTQTRCRRPCEWDNKWWALHQSGGIWIQEEGFPPFFSLCWFRFRQMMCPNTLLSSSSSAKPRSEQSRTQVRFIPINNKASSSRYMFPKPRSSFKKKLSQRLPHIFALVLFYCANYS